MLLYLGSLANLLAVETLPPFPNFSLLIPTLSEVLPHHSTSTQALIETPKWEMNSPEANLNRRKNIPKLNGIPERKEKHVIEILMLLILILI